ncbi:MAG: helix-turn-helix domain-containing protein [Aristaeellaceae bacterium]
MAQIGLPSIAGWEMLDADKLSVMRIAPPTDHMHGHKFFELVYVMEGSALHQLGSDSFRIAQGDYFVVDVGSFHRYQTDERFVIVNCLFAPEYVDRALVNCPSLSALLSNEMRQFGASRLDTRLADRTYHDEDGSIRRLIEAMEREYAQRSAGYLELIRCHLIEVLVHTVRQAAAKDGVGRLHPAAAAMAEYLHEHYTQPLSLRVLSERTGYTPQYLCSLFHRETGMSPNVYLQKIRVEHSCRLLAETCLGVAKIAQSVGYADLKHFSSIFRRYTGLSPRAYRARTTPAKA